MSIGNLAVILPALGHLCSEVLVYTKIWPTLRFFLAVSVSVGLAGCYGLEPRKAEPIQDVEPIAVPTDGTWDYERVGNPKAGYGEWSSREDGAEPIFSFRIDSPPALTQQGSWIVMESAVQIRRNNDGQFPLELAQLHASLVPGVSIMDERGRLRYDETYGDASITCPVEELAIGEETTCAVSYTERYHPDWLQDSYWRMHASEIGTWPSQTSN